MTEGVGIIGGAERALDEVLVEARHGGEADALPLLEDPSHGQLRTSGA